MFLHGSFIDTLYKLIQLDVGKKENYLPYDSVKLPTATKELLSSSKASETNKLKFKELFSVVLKNTVIKLQERSTLKCGFVYSLPSLVPKYMAGSKVVAISKFTKVVKKFYENKYLTFKESDNTKLQYEKFMNHIASRYQEEFVSFDMSNDQVDHFF